MISVQHPVRRLLPGLLVLAAGVVAHFPTGYQVQPEPYGKINLLLIILMAIFIFINVHSFVPTETCARLADNSAPPAWYHMPERPPLQPVQPLQPPPFELPRSPYGPQQPSGFVPVPSPFALPRPKNPMEIANGHLVDAAQEVGWEA